MQSKTINWDIMARHLIIEVTMAIDAEGRPSACVYLFNKKTPHDRFSLEQLVDIAPNLNHTFGSGDMLQGQLALDVISSKNGHKHVDVKCALEYLVQGTREPFPRQGTLTSFDIDGGEPAPCPPPPAPPGPQPSPLPQDGVSGAALFPYIVLRRQLRVAPERLAYAFAAAPAAVLAAPFYQALNANPRPTLAAMRQQAALFQKSADYIADPAHGPELILLGQVEQLAEAPQDSPADLAANIEALYQVDTPAAMAALLASDACAGVLCKVWLSYISELVMGDPDYSLLGRYAQVMRAGHLLDCLFAPAHQRAPMSAATLAKLRAALIMLPAPVFPLPPPTGNAPVPASAGLMIGELAMVRHKLLRHELGELAHVESVMPGERREIFRKHTSARLTQESRQVQEADGMEDHDDDTQNRLIRQAQQAIAEKAVTNNYNNFTTTYGPPTEATLNGKWTEMTLQGRNPASDDATEFARNILSRTVSRITRDVVQTRASSTFDQAENSVNSIIDNSAMRSQQTCAFRWINKVYEATASYYGKRLMIEISVDQPARQYGLACQGRDGPVVPLPVTLAALGVGSFAAVTADNYASLAAAYGVTELTPPPAPLRILSQTLRSGDEASVSIPAGYCVSNAVVNFINEQDGTAKPVVLVGREQFAAGAAPQPRTFGEEHAISIAVPASPAPAATTAGADASAPTGTGATRPVPDVLVNVTIECQPGAGTLDAWRIKTYEALLKGYHDQLGLFHGKSSKGEPHMRPARSRAAARRIERSALKQACVQSLLAQMEAAGASGTDVDRAFALQFLNMAVEWNELSARFYSGLAGEAGVPGYLTEEDDNVHFATFLAADRAVVTLPVFPAFDVRFLYALQTGSIWNIWASDAPIHQGQAGLAYELRYGISHAPFDGLAGAWEMVVPTAMQVLDSAFQIAPGAAGQGCT